MNELSSDLAYFGSALVLFGVLMITLETELVAKLPEKYQPWL